MNTLSFSLARISKSNTEELIQLDQFVMPKGLRAVEAELKQYSSDPKSMIVFIKQETRRLGYVLVVPTEVIAEKLTKYDPAFRPSPKICFLETLAVDSPQVNWETYDEAFKAVIGQVKKVGWFAMDFCVTKEGLSAEIQNRYGAALQRTISNYRNYGKDYDYLRISFETGSLVPAPVKPIALEAMAK